MLPTDYQWVIRHAILFYEISRLTGKAIAGFLEEHIHEMKSVSPPESKHALDLEGLRKPEITFWSVHENDEIVGCAALKELDRDHGEIKSMRTSQTYRGNGIATKLMRHILETAISRNYRKVSLETGSMDFFEPARSLYRKFGFTNCAPFSEYVEDPNSVFMTLNLLDAQRAAAGSVRQRVYSMRLNAEQETEA